MSTSVSVTEPEACVAGVRDRFEAARLARTRLDGELAGIHDILSKSLGSQNPINLVKATVAGLEALRTPREVAAIRGLSINEVLGVSSAREQGETIAADAPADETTEAAPEAEQEVTA